MHDQFSACDCEGHSLVVNCTQYCKKPSDLCFLKRYFILVLSSASGFYDKPLYPIINDDDLVQQRSIYEKVFLLITIAPIKTVFQYFLLGVVVCI